MLNKFKQHCAKPITWGAYYKMCGVSFALSVLVGGACMVKTMMDWKRLMSDRVDGNEEEEAE